MAEYYFNPFGQSEQKQNEFQMRLDNELKKAKEKKELRKIGIGLGTAITMYVVLQVVASGVLMRLHLYDTYSNNPAFQNSFNIIFISTLSVALPFGIVALIFRKSYKNPVVPTTPLKPVKLFLWVSAGMCTCLISNVIVSGLIEFVKNTFNRQLTQGEISTPNSLFSCVIEVVGLAIIPAITEEFAMRCCSLQLLRKYGNFFAVIAVSTVFGLLHGNVIQFVFAFLLGMILGYITIKTESIVPAILIHCLNNGMSAIQDIVSYIAGKDLKSSVTVVLFLFWGVVGAVSILLLILGKDFKRAHKEKPQTSLTVGDKIAAFAPGMIVPFIILIAITIQTIKPI